MSELPPDEIAATGADPGRRKPAAHRVQTRAVTSAPAATPIADMVEAMLSGGIPVDLVVLAVRTSELARGATDPVAEPSIMSANGELRNRDLRQVSLPLLLLKFTKKKDAVFT